MADTTPSSSRTTRPRRSPLARAMSAVLLGALGIPGCISYTNVPEPESPPAFRSANHFQAKRVARVALDEVIGRFPMRDARGRYSVNLPAGTTLETAQEIIDALPEGAVLPTEGMDDSIPVYHIGRIWIRASDAKVDVLYPARSFDGGAFMGNVTVWLNGGVRRWKPGRLQHWAPGTIPVPPIYVPIPEAQMNAQDSPEPAAPAQEGTPETDAPEPLPEPEPEPDPQPAVQAEQPDPQSQYRQVPVDD